MRDTSSSSPHVVPYVVKYNRQRDILIIGEENEWHSTVHVHFVSLILIFKQRNIRENGEMRSNSNWLAIAVNKV